MNPQMLSNMGACCKTEPDSSQTEIELRRIRETIEGLKNRLVTLGDKISPVLRSQSLAGCGTSAPECELVPLASEIRMCRYGVEGCVATVVDMLDRMEL